MPELFFLTQSNYRNVNVYPESCGEQQYMASLYIVSLTFKMSGRCVTNRHFMRKKKGTRLELVNKNVLINVSKSVFTQVSYQPSLKPESLHAVFYFLFVFTLEHPNRVMNDLLMLDY